MYKTKILLTFLAQICCLFSCQDTQEQAQEPPMAGVPLGEQCFEYKGDNKRIYVRLMVEDTLVVGSYKEYIRDDVRAEYFTKSSSFRAIRKKDGLDVFLTNESGIQSRAIWYLKPHELKLGSFKCVPMACVAPEDVRQKQISKINQYKFLIDKQLKNLTPQHKTYRSPSLKLEGKTMSYYKNTHLLKLIDEQQSPNGRILTKYYFTEKDELLAVSRTEWRNTSENIQEMRHEDLFFENKKLTAVLEKFSVQNSSQTADSKSAVASDITENISSMLASKSKRHLEEAFAFVGFVQSPKGYDAFFNY